MTAARIIRALVLLVSLVGATLCAEAQHANVVARIGLLPFGSPSNEYDRSLVEAFRLGLHEIGIIENRDIALVVVQPSPVTFRHRDRVVDVATKHGLGVIFAFPPAARAGALVAYDPDYADLCRRAASYADRILKGTKPADLAVQEPTKLDLIVNLKSAKALGLTIPESLRVQATETIE